MEKYTIYSVGKLNNIHVYFESVICQQRQQK